MSALKTNMLMQISRFRCITNGSQVPTVVPQRDAISCKSPVSRLQVLPQILPCNPSSFWSVATNFHPEFFDRTGTVKWQWDAEPELSAREIQCNGQKFTCTTRLTCGGMLHGVIVRRLAVIFKDLVFVDAVRKRNIRTSTCIRTEAVQLAVMSVFLLRHVPLIPMVF
jgi:hypothetical protein